MNTAITIASIIVGIVFAEIVFLLSAKAMKTNIGDKNFDFLTSSVLKFLTFVLVIPITMFLFDLFSNINFNGLLDLLKVIGGAVVGLGILFALFWFNYRIAKTL